MAEKNMQKQIDEINKKLDIILEEIEHQKRHRREMDDLKDDLTRVGKDLYLTVVDELEEVHDHISMGDMLYLGKKVLRNVNNITKMLEQLESVTDFLHDASPLTREYILDFMKKMDELDRKGYFEFIKESVKILNVVTIMNTVKNLTQPDMLHSINNAVAVYKKLDIEVEKEVSVFRLLKELNDPELKRGVAFSIQFLKNLAKRPKENN